MRKKGFTLLELICAIAIGSILIVLINNIVKTNLSISKKAYEDEIDYKNSTNCILYIENVIRKSDKIIDFKNENNFKLLISEGKNKSTYRFEQNGKKLYVYINNLKSNSQREIKIPIGYCSDSKISYDKNDDSFSIDIDFYEKEGNSNYKSDIRRLEWKKEVFYPFMFW